MCHSSWDNHHITGIHGDNHPATLVCTAFPKNQVRGTLEDAFNVMILVSILQSSILHYLPVPNLSFGSYRSIHEYWDENVSL